MRKTLAACGLASVMVLGVAATAAAQTRGAWACTSKWEKDNVSDCKVGGETSSPTGDDPAARIERHYEEQRRTMDEAIRKAGEDIKRILANHDNSVSPSTDSRPSYAPRPSSPRAASALNDAINAEIRRQLLNRRIAETIASQKLPGASDVFTATNPGSVPAEGQTTGPTASGQWRTGSLIATCGSPWLWAANFQASIVNASGWVTCQGGYLEVSNVGRFPVYFGLSGVVNDYLKPGETRRIYLPQYRSPSDTSSVRVPLMVRYWAE